MSKGRVLEEDVPDMLGSIAYEKKQVCDKRIIETVVTSCSSLNSDEGKSSVAAN